MNIINEWVRIEHPFLAAGLEDYQVALEIDRIGTSRHAVCLMHDTLEFLFYELLISLNQDIYRNGQNTIGIDEAITSLAKLEIELPSISAIRSIQKHRGDAKHHAQTIDEETYVQLLAGFQEVISRIVHEHFSHTLGKHIEDIELLSYHHILHDTYYRSRNHNWERAARFAVGSLLHGLRAYLDIPDDYIFGRTKNIYDMIKYFERDVQLEAVTHFPQELVNGLRNSPKELRIYVQAKEFKDAAELADSLFYAIENSYESPHDNN